MSMTVNAAAARLQREVPAAEASIDDALITLTNLMHTMIVARRDTGVAANTGQTAIARLAKAQLALVEASSDVLRVHGELAKVAQEQCAMPMDCPKSAELDAPVERMASVA